MIEKLLIFQSTNKVFDPLPQLTVIKVLHMTSQHLMLHTQVMEGDALPHLSCLGHLHHLAPHALHPPMEHGLVQHLLRGPDMNIEYEHLSRCQPYLPNHVHGPGYVLDPLLHDAGHAPPYLRPAFVLHHRYIAGG